MRGFKEVETQATEPRTTGRFRMLVASVFGVWGLGFRVWGLRFREGSELGMCDFMRHCI